MGWKGLGCSKVSWDRFVVGLVLGLSSWGSSGVWCALKGRRVRSTITVRVEGLGFRLEYRRLAFQYDE